MCVGGSAQGMANSLKINRGQLKKRPKMFSRDSRYSTINATYNEEAKDYKTTGAVSYEKRRVIRKKREKKLKIERIVSISVAILIASIVVWFFSSKTAQKVVLNNTPKVEVTRSETEYLKFLTYGDSWLDAKKWEPAITMYEKALEIYPNSFDAKYRLALAYSYSCNDLHTNCFEGKELIEDLKKSNPSKTNQLAVLDSIFRRRNVEPVFIR